MKLLDAFAVLPQVKRAMPEAKLPFERPGVIGMMAASTVAVRAVRTSPELRPLVRELASGFLSLAPALAALRGGELAAYHGAEHVSIGTYEHGERRPKEHERCGSHLVGPLLATSAVGNVLAARAPEQLRGPARAAAAVGAAAASVELFGWMTRHPDTTLARALRRPGTSSRPASPRRSRARRSSRSRRPRSTRAWPRSTATAAPAETKTRLPPETFSLPVEKMKAGYYTDAYFNHTRETLLADGRRPAC